MATKKKAKKRAAKKRAKVKNAPRRKKRSAPRRARKGDRFEQLTRAHSQAVARGDKTLAKLVRREILGSKKGRRRS